MLDLDGVLADSEALIRYAFERSFHETVGRGAPPTERFLMHMGEHFPDIMAALDLPPTLWHRFRTISTEERGRVRTFAGAIPFLLELRAMNLRVGILTGKDRERTMEVLRHLDLLTLVDAVVAGDDTARAKPDPAAMRRVLELLEVPPARALMIGDSVTDVLCARRAGVRSVGVTWGICPERMRDVCQPDHLVDTWPALLDIVCGWSGALR